MRNSRIFSLLAGIALPLVGIGIIVSCSAASSSTTTVAVTGVTIDDKSITEVTMGSTLQLNATVSPDDATDKRVTWSSSDTRIATVDENGLVTPVKGSDTAITITVTSVADSGITDSIDITKVVVADRVPSAPRITGSVSEVGQVQVNWVEPIDKGIINGDGSPGVITKYTVYWGASGVDTTSSNKADVNSGTTYTITGLRNGSEVFFIVTAWNKKGESMASTEGSATPSTTTVAVTGVTIDDISP